MINKTVKQQKAEILDTLIDEYYQENSTGGNLHIVLDDGNLEDGSIKHSIVFATNDNDFWGIFIGRLLLEFTLEERSVIVENTETIENYDWKD